jgi:hypothetical protein
MRTTAVGDTIRVAAEGPIRRFRISGVAKVGDVDSIGGATFGLFDVPTAQSVLGKKGELDSIFLAAKPGVADADVARQVRPHLPASASVQTGAEHGRGGRQGDERRDQHHSVLPACVRGDLADRRLVRHLQHAFDDRGPARAELATLRTLEASRR